MAWFGLSGGWELPRPQSMEDLRLTEDPLDVNAAFAFVTEPATGATSIFVGTTR
jgi:molybdopterin synthase catalytic subunit